jgi:DNA transformation protein
MAVSAEDIAFVTDLFSDLAPISTRKMMGGLSIYSDGQIFAMMFGDGTLMLKASGALAQELADLGCTAFTYTNKKSGKLVSMPYWSLPDAALDDPTEACIWARKSLQSNG